jgi:hypothetical protein
VTFDYEAMENRELIRWCLMPTLAREMLDEAEALGAIRQFWAIDGIWYNDKRAVHLCGVYRIVGWRAPGDEPEPLAGMSANASGEGREV